MLCTRQKSFHCPSTLVRPRSVKRSSPLLCRRFANTGSTVAKRCPYCARPSGVSMRSLHARSCASRGGVGARPRKNATCATGRRLGRAQALRAQRARAAQSRFAPRNCSPTKPFVHDGAVAPCDTATCPAGQTHVRASAIIREVVGLKTGRAASSAPRLVVQRIGRRAM